MAITHLCPMNLPEKPDRWSYHFETDDYTMAESFLTNNPKFCSFPMRKITIDVEMDLEGG